MDCPEVQERLPWHLNGTLQPGEQDGLRRHLETCSACREELRETKRAASVFGAHLSSLAIVDVAWQRPLAGLDPETARRHLEGCASCGEELADARESRRAADEPERARSPAARAAWWKQAPLAAALVLGLAAGVFWRSGSGPMDTGAAERERLAVQLAEASSEAARLRDREADLQRRLERLEAPQANVPVVELQPEGSTHRSGAQRPNEVVLAAGAPFVALVLDSAAPGSRAVTVEVRSADGTLLWRVADLRASELGGYTLALPTERLREGKVTLVVSGADGSGKPESYVLNVRRQR